MANEKKLSSEEKAAASRQKKADKALRRQNRLAIVMENRYMDRRVRAPLVSATTQWVTGKVVDVEVDSNLKTYLIVRTTRGDQRTHQDKALLS
jgi:hypothetical protein